MMNRHPKYTPGEPVVTARAFLGGLRKYKANEVFDVAAEKADQAIMDNLIATGYVRHGVPVEQVVDPVRELAKRAKFEGAMAKGAAERAETSARAARVAASLRRPGHPA